jgi:hypothetical protein
MPAGSSEFRQCMPYKQEDMKIFPGNASWAAYFYDFLGFCLGQNQSGA